MQHRDDIQGLRGVAVLLVVLAHAGVEGFAGGFLGVDVFFVISGFLITGLLTREVEATGRIDYWNFYARRAKRLLPALAVMLLATVVVCLLMLSREAAMAQLQTAGWAALWLSNAHLVVAQVDYFGAGAGDDFFVHTWSLGVEEQFYLLWPLLVAVAWKRFGAGSRWMGVAMVASFAACAAVLPYSADAAYYSMPTRLWQLAAGALAFRLASQAPRLPPGARAVAGGVGLALLALAVFAHRGTWSAAWALLPTAAAAAILWSGSVGQPLASRLLATAPLRAVGAISYSWYLWHWPVFVFARHVRDAGHADLGTFAPIMASLLLATASYLLVERPFRARTFSESRRVVAVALCGSSVVACALLVGGPWLVQWSQQGREARADIEARLATFKRMPSIYRGAGCDEWFQSARVVPCEILPGRETRGSIVFIGDSVGMQWLPAIEQVAVAWRMRLVGLTKSACPIVDAPIVYPTLRRRYTECEEWRAGVVDYVRAQRPSLVILGSAGNYDYTPAQWTEGTRRIALALGRSDIPVVVLAPTPVLPFNARDCVVANGERVGARIEAPSCTTSLAGAENGDAIVALAQATASVPRASLLRLNDLVCPRGQCEAMAGGRLVFGDDLHLTVEQVEALAPEVQRRLAPLAGDAAGPGR